MIGTPLIAGWFAHVAFWVLLGFAARAERWRVVLVFIVLWVIGYVASGRVAVWGSSRGTRSAVRGMRARRTPPAMGCCSSTLIRIRRRRCFRIWSPRSRTAAAWPAD